VLNNLRAVLVEALARVDVDVHISATMGKATPQQLLAFMKPVMVCTDCGSLRRCHVYYRLCKHFYLTWFGYVPLHLQDVSGPNSGALPRASPCLQVVLGALGSSSSIRSTRLLAIEKVKTVFLKPEHECVFKTGFAIQACPHPS
jgi:hypothetical protein